MSTGCTTRKIEQCLEQFKATVQAAVSSGHDEDGMVCLGACKCCRVPGHTVNAQHLLQLHNTLECMTHHMRDMKDESDEMFKAVQDVLNNTAHDTASCAKRVDRLTTCFKVTQTYTKNKMDEIRFRLDMSEHDMRKLLECIVNQAKELDDVKERMVCAIAYLNCGLISIHLCVLRLMCSRKWRRRMTRRIRSGSTSSFVWMTCFSVLHKPSWLTARPRRVIRLLILMAGCSLVDPES